MSLLVERSREPGGVCRTHIQEVKLRVNVFGVPGAGSLGAPRHPATLSPGARSPRGLGPSNRQASSVGCSDGDPSWSRTFLGDQGKNRLLSPSPAFVLLRGARHWGGGGAAGNSRVETWFPNGLPRPRLRRLCFLLLFFNFWTFRW